MTLQQMIYAVTIAECGSMNRAAQTLFLSQSSLSASVRNLEEEIGQPLFRRTNRGVSATPEGEEFLIYARQIVNQYRLTEEKFILRKESRKSFGVSSQHYTFAVKAFIEMAKQFSLDEYAFTIYECRTAEIIENVRSYKSELGILYLDDFNRDILLKIFDDNGLEFTELFACRTFVFLSAGHPLAGRKSIALEDLTPYPCLSFYQGEGEAFYLSEEVYSTWHYRQIIKASDRATFLNLMLGLNGYTLCSGILCEDLNGNGYRAVPLKSDKIMHIGYIRRKGGTISTLAGIYIDELKKCDTNVL
ncbi:MAG: LysR family transcriptional regulator [Lachnospiraceae bacterium]|jgi:DNA-binding transcriptional LysR family regulator|nr:LysR family transcriptional regulator [Lachnospiraceae bacterium]